MLAPLPTDPGIEVQVCGDAHLANFGMFASPERALVFDINDFDETVVRIMGMGREAVRDECGVGEWE